MANNYDIIRFRRGLRQDLSHDTLLPSEPGFTTDTNQLFIGIEDSINEIQIDPFPNAHQLVQAWLDGSVWAGHTIDEDLVIRNIVTPTDVENMLIDMRTLSTFGQFARARRNVEVITENTHSNLYADQHLGIYDISTGKRSSLYQKHLLETSGTFASYRDGVSMTAPSFVMIDYSLVQSGVSGGTFDGIKYVRVGTIKVINGEPNGILQTKLTDENTEIWQDDGNLIAEPDEFSNIVFESALNDVGGGNYDLLINYTQDAEFQTTITYTVKRWTM